LVLILLVAAGLAGALGHAADAVVILAVVVVNALLGTLQEGRAARSMAALRRVASLRARVVRERRETVIAVSELVPGDVLLLASGDAVGADARLVDAAQLQTAEAALTGESLPVHKSVAAVPEEASLADRRNMVYSGTFVTGGRGRAIVLAIGGRPRSAASPSGRRRRRKPAPRWSSGWTASAARCCSLRWPCSSWWWCSVSCATCRSPRC
jgi:magnesium-transporting ATPase (P-type)